MNLDDFGVVIPRSQLAREDLARARDCVANADWSGGRVHYLKAVEALKQACEQEGECYRQDWEAATKEYEEFVKRDPIFNDLWRKVEPIVREEPAILQTELYQRLPGIQRSDLSYGLYFAAKQGKLVRSKRGRTYELRLP